VIVEAAGIDVQELVPEPADRGDRALSDADHAHLRGPNDCGLNVRCARGRCQRDEQARTASAEYEDPVHVEFILGASSHVSSSSGWGTCCRTR
jgi:hypothetical protein